LLVIVIHGSGHDHIVKNNFFFFEIPIKKKLFQIFWKK
jgi:hypothetical protein